MKLFIIISFILVSSSFSYSQVYLNDTTYYNGIWCSYNGVCEVDSGFFVMGSLSRYEYNSDLALMLGYFSNEGNKLLIADEYDTLTNQKNYGSIHDLVLNDRGNFVYFYNNCSDVNGCYPRLREVSPNGVVVFDSILQPIMDTANLRTLDFNNFIQKKDSSYLLLVNVTDTARLNSPSQGGGGVFSIHLDNNFNLISSIRYFTSGSLIQRGYSYAQQIELDSGKMILLIPEVKQSGTNVNEEARILFMKIDAQGAIISKSYYSDGQKSILPFAFTQTFDKGYLFTYAKGEWDGNSWIYRDYIAKVDSSFSFKWRISVEPNQVGIYAVYKEYKIVKTLDSHFVTAGGSSNYVLPYQASAQLSKFNNDGDILWQRKHFKITDTSDIWTVTVDMKDVIATKDSGYCMVGQVFDYPAFSVGAVSKYGYLVKTNCLGFLGNAVASASIGYEDNFELTFYNGSMQAGSYLWDFGDGTTMTTGEGVDTVYHSYPSPPEALEGKGYDAMLIAYGCYDSLGVRDADTVLFTVTPKLHKDPAVVTNGNGYFTVFPNPVVAGSPLYVYLNGLNPNDGEVAMKVFGNDGKYVAKYVLSASEGSYEIDNKLASGIYLLVLEQGGKKLEVEKLIIN